MKRGKNAASPWLGIVSVAALGGLATMCFPDTTGDFENFKDRTAGARQETEAGPSIGVAPSMSFTGLYYGVCLTQLSQDDPTRVLRFYSHATYEAGATFMPMDDGGADASSSGSSDGGDGGDGSAFSGPGGQGNEAKVMGPSGGAGVITLNLQTLRARNGVTPAPAPNVSQMYTLGGVITAKAPVAADGTFSLSFGDLAVDAEANGVSPRPISAAHVVTAGYLYDKAKFCTTLAGDLVEPTMIALLASKNTCIFIAVNEGDPLPPSPDFKCP
jgi:hypothetical protein